MMEDSVGEEDGDDGGGGDGFSGGCNFVSSSPLPLPFTQLLLPSLAPLPGQHEATHALSLVQPSPTQPQLEER